LDSELTSGARDNMPVAEVDIDVDLVRRLIESQRPDLSQAEITPLAFGWDNISFRIGERRIARLPRRELAVELISNEATWLPELAPFLPLPIPAPEFRGEPGEGYPWPWLIAPLLPGEPAAYCAFDTTAVAHQLGQFLSSLHRPAPADAPRNPFRGGPLSSRADGAYDRFAIVTDSGNRRRLENLFRDSMEAPVHSGAPVWLHGDLHPLNILIEDEAISAVVDFGDITAGDPATDLSAGWSLVADAHEEFWRAYGGGDDSLRLRARGWAIALGLGFVDTSADHPTIGRIGQDMLRAVLDLS